MTIKLIGADVAKLMVWHSHQISHDTLKWWGKEVLRISDTTGKDAFALSKQWNVSLYRIEDWITLGFDVTQGDPEFTAQDIDSLESLSYVLMEFHHSQHQRECPCKGRGIKAVAPGVHTGTVD